MDNGISRLQQFRELRSTIRGSESILVVGVDVAKDKHYAFFGTANGRTLWRKLIFDNSIQSFNRLRSMAQDLSTQHSLHACVFGLEPTASYHKPLAEHLIKNGEQVVYVSNVAAKKTSPYWMVVGIKMTPRMPQTLLILLARGGVNSMILPPMDYGNYEVYSLIVPN